MVRVRVVNWRCIEDLELGLSRINFFIGKNSTGKSSLAYSIYFASRSSRYDPGTLLSHLRILLSYLYGYNDFNMIARLAEGKPQFPIVIEIEDSRLIVRDGSSVSVSMKTLWSDSFLLPSRRISYFQSMMLLPKLIETSSKTPSRSEAQLMGGVLGFFAEIFKIVQGILSPPFMAFVDDYIRALAGFKSEIGGGFEGVGSYLIEISPLIHLMKPIFRDPYTKLEFPIELAPDGLLDFTIFDSVSQRIPENSLIVLEEPEIYKNPNMVMDFTKHVIKRVMERKSYIIMTTHSDIPLHVVSKLVVEGSLKAEDVKIYYFKRDPWTMVSEIKIYEDGTLESLPDSEELITRLF
ncbi:MAG: AAA family ATPase [Sulfolobales archaeon]